MKSNALTPTLELDCSPLLPLLLLLLLPTLPKLRDLNRDDMLDGDNKELET